MEVSNNDLSINQTVFDINKLLMTTFKENNITIYGTWEEPLFKAQDIGELLEIKDIRTSLSYFLDKIIKTFKPLLLERTLHKYKKERVNGRCVGSTINIGLDNKQKLTYVEHT